MQSQTPPPVPRAPAARQKMQQAEQVLAELETNVALLALGASEGAAGAEKALAAHRSKIEAAERSVSELRKAVELAARLDRQTDAQAAATMRAAQFADFKKAMALRDKSMTAVLEAARAMASAYGEYSEATLAAQIAAPSGTAIPVMNVGPNGLLGPAFGPCERLILAEFYRLAPRRSDGLGRFVLPFAKSPSITDLDERAMPPGIDEMRAANQTIIAEIEAQLGRLNGAAIAATEKKVA